MYNRFSKCNCMMHNNNQALEDVCDDVQSMADGYMNNCNMCKNIKGFNMNNYDCGCGFDEEPNVFPDNPMLAQSYVPIQTLDKTFTPCCGLKNGTIFPELVSPYEPCQNMRFNEYLMRRNQIGEGCNG